MSRVPPGSAAPRPLWRRLLYWGLPPLLLWWIAQHMDFARLAHLASELSPLLLGAMLALVFLKIGVGALRWFLLAQAYGCSGLSFRRSAVEYWASLALGTVMPGTLGADGYRVATGGHRTGRYAAAACAMLVEKAGALLSCAVLLAATLWALPMSGRSAALQQILNPVWTFLLGTALVVFLLVLMRSSRGIETFVGWLGEAVQRRVQRVAPLASATPWFPLWQLSLAPRVWLPTLGLSLLIHVATAVMAHVLLLDMGLVLPFVVSLFVAPLVIILTSLPITVAGLGVREAVFLLCYGAFGVPAEAALLVSFVLMASTLIGQAPGAAFIGLNRGKGRGKSGHESEQPTPALKGTGEPALPGAKP